MKALKFRSLECSEQIILAFIYDTRSTTERNCATESSKAWLRKLRNSLHPREGAHRPCSFPCESAKAWKQRSRRSEGVCCMQLCTFAGQVLKTLGHRGVPAKVYLLRTMQIASEHHQCFPSSRPGRVLKFPPISGRLDGNFMSACQMFVSTTRCT